VRAKVPGRDVLLKNSCCLNRAGSSRIGVRLAFSWVSTGTSSDGRSSVEQTFADHQKYVAFTPNARGAANA
jgi:hypothetical protein